MAVVGAVGAVGAVGTFPIIVDGEQRVQDDGDNLQNQGQDGELQPHVGGVRRHPQTDSDPSLFVCLCSGDELWKNGEESDDWF